MLFGDIENCVGRVTALARVALALDAARVHHAGGLLEHGVDLEVGADRALGLATPADVDAGGGHIGADHMDGRADAPGEVAGLTQRLGRGVRAVRADDDRPDHTRCS